MYVMIKELCQDKYASLFGALFFSFLSSSWLYGVRAQTEAQTIFFVALSFLFLIKYKKESKPFYMYLFYAMVGLAAATRYQAAFLLLLVPLLFFKESHFKKKELWLGFPLFILTFSPQLLFNYFQYGSPFHTWVSSYPTKLFSLSHFFSAGPRRPPIQILVFLKEIFLDFEMASPLLVPFYLLGVWYLFKRKKYFELKLVLFVVFGYLLFFSFLSIHNLRYLFYITPVLILLAALGFYYARTRFDILKKPIVVILLISLIVLPSFSYSFIRVQTAKNHLDVRKDVAEWVNKNTDEPAILLSNAPTEFAYYSGRLSYHVTSQNSSIIEGYLTNNHRVYFATVMPELSYIAGVQNISKPGVRYFSEKISLPENLNNTFDFVLLQEFKSEYPRDFGLLSFVGLCKCPTDENSSCLPQYACDSGVLKRFLQKHLSAYVGVNNRKLIEVWRVYEIKEKELTGT